MDTKSRMKCNDLIIKGFIAIIIMTNSVVASEVDVCVKVLENITSPVNEYGCGSLLSLPPDAICAVNPLCCTPGVCKITPACGFVKTTIETIASKGDVHCFKDISAEKLWGKWKDRQIAITADLLTGGLGEVILPFIKADIKKITAQAKYMPKHLQSLLKEIIYPIYNHGNTGYTYADVNNIKIINQGYGEDIKLWLKKGKDAITLGSVVIMDDEKYSQLMSTTNNYTLNELLIGNRASLEYSNALSLMVHELVHVRQYRELGQDTFLINYGLRALIDDYGQGKYEQEAYSFTPNIFELHGGAVCNQVREGLNDFIKDYNLSRGEMKCKPYIDIALIISFL